MEYGPWGMHFGVASTSYESVALNIASSSNDRRNGRRKKYGIRIEWYGGKTIIKRRRKKKHTQTVNISRFYCDMILH